MPCDQFGAHPTLTELMGDAHRALPLGEPTSDEIPRETVVGEEILIVEPGDDAADLLAVEPLGTELLPQLRA